MRISFSRRAQADIQSIYDYIARDNAEMARRVVAAIEHATLRLSDFPLSGRIGAVETTRELVLPRLPYIAVYRIISDRVEIIAVFRAAQNFPRG